MRIIFTILSIAAIYLVSSCSSDDGSSTTGNTQEYFKYTVDGVERIFDNEVEIHIETSSTTNLIKFEFNANGISPNTNDFRRVAGTFSFPDMATFNSSTIYDWGVSDGVTKGFYFSETTSTNLFFISPDFSINPITATITTAIPTNVGDFIEFSFTGSYVDSANATHSISGVCRAERDLDQNL
ncbi:hypothetical protein [Cellulophaga sp. Z1A5H]|uniref:hypothetical protein n=1 Tax=Cellulophaga sp. Z1A5H TaxID=2687291 RepID=UPI0013FE3CCF|nr:hypothetical protein [Cellulophaga sp. Z1A5H]